MGTLSKGQEDIKKNIKSLYEQLEKIKTAKHHNYLAKMVVINDL